MATMISNKVDDIAAGAVPLERRGRDDPPTSAWLGEVNTGGNDCLASSLQRFEIYTSMSRHRNLGIFGAAV